MDIFIILILVSVFFLNIFILIGVFSFFRGAISGAPFVPSRKKMVEEMISLAGEMENKKVYDLGCGDGRLVFAAENKGAIASGIEISFFVSILARIQKIIRSSSSIIINDSLWNQDVSDADIIFVYLLPVMMKQFEEEKVPTLKKGCVIISNGFAFPTLKPTTEKKISRIHGRVLRYEV